MIAPISPPTDSLYKFMSLTGLVLVVFSAYSMQQLDNDYTERLLELNSLTLISKAEVDAMKDRKDALLDKSKHLLKILKQPKVDPKLLISDPDWQIGRLNQIETEQKELLASLAAAGVSLAKVDSLRTTTEFAKSSLIDGKRMYSSFFIFGMLLSLSGFWLWYSKIQIHQDRQVASTVGDPPAT